MKLSSILEQVMASGLANYGTKARRPFKATNEETGGEIDENGDYIDESGRVWKGWTPVGKNVKRAAK